MLACLHSRLACLLRLVGTVQVWWRGVNDRKREVEEKAKQLEQVASLSALIAGFALVSLVEINIQGAFLRRISCPLGIDLIYGSEFDERATISNFSFRRPSEVSLKKLDIVGFGVR